MLILLQSFNKFGDYAELELITGHVNWFPPNVVFSGTGRPIRGEIARLDEHTVILYRDGEMLHFRVDATDIALTDDTQIKLVRGTFNVIEVTQNDSTVFRLEYKPYELTQVDEWRMFLNPAIEEENFDFGLYIYNTTKKTSNRKNIYRQ